MGLHSRSQLEDHRTVEDGPSQWTEGGCVPWRDVGRHLWHWLLSHLGLADWCDFKAGCGFYFGPAVCSVPSHPSALSSRPGCPTRLGLPFCCLPQFGVDWLNVPGTGPPPTPCPSPASCLWTNFILLGLPQVPKSNFNQRSEKMQKGKQSGKTK